LTKLLSREEAAQKLGVSLSTFDRIRKQRQIPTIKIGNLVKIDEEKLKAWTDELEERNNAI